ncbi:hypothetical protein DPMN_172143 [Dreissena polymorpha]|uniref:Uncharacterized protein n=1 Tax=Dreissena polymorpha TaxID=45954 RepID=A0A9D4E1Q6_DREPO|nr:hypothetical protein DPMN_172143 [Dreissena polymorpha]
MIIFCGFEWRQHDVHGDLTATLATTSLLRLLRLYGVPTTSLTERRKTPDFGDYFEHVRGLAS